MNVKQCPICKKYNVKLYNDAKLRSNGTEVLVAAYCPDCGYSWHIIYQPKHFIQ